MTIFEHENYKEFVRERISLMPKKGRGELQKLAQELRMHSTRVSHIFNGDLHLTLEQASGLCKYWGLSQMESEYFLILVQIARAGSADLRQLLSNQAKGLRERSKLLVNRVQRDRILSEHEKAVFYSSWMYSAIRMLTSIDKYQTLDEIANYYELPRERVREILDFLVGAGLCVEKDGRYTMGSQHTHLEATSMLVKRHHANWRLKALARHEKDHLSPQELSYTCPASISRKDQAKLRELLVQTIEKFLKTVNASEPVDMVACLNIDWFEF